MSSVSKGAQAEREAEAALQADGWLTYRVMRGGRWYQPKDLFGCIDIVAKKEGLPYTRWVQVTAAASFTHKLVEMLTVPWNDSDVVEIWQRMKGRGRHFRVFAVHPAPPESTVNAGGIDRV